MAFNVSIASEENELVDIYKLRYKVYCLEWGFEKPDNYPNGLLTDIYDGSSIQFTVRDPSQKLVGAIRLILASNEGFPIEKYCHLDIDTSKIPRNKTAEISRLVIHRDYRRRAEDKFIYGPDEERRSIGSFSYQYNYSYSRRYEDKHKFRQNSHRPNPSQIERRRRHEVFVGLYKAIYSESKKREITHLYSVMTKGIVSLLDKFGLKFDPIGDPVDYHGIRTPYLGEIDKIEQEMMASDPELYNEFIRG